MPGVHLLAGLGPSAAYAIETPEGVVLIDTGPILGSIEATPVCAAADAVILTVARGQQRPLVEKALQHLLSIGARFAGVVFNRAQTRDFERSISGMSLRSGEAMMLSGFPRVSADV